METTLHFLDYNGCGVRAVLICSAKSPPINSFLLWPWKELRPDRLVDAHSWRWKLAAS